MIDPVCTAAVATPPPDLTFCFHKAYILRHFFNRPLAEQVHPALLMWRGKTGTFITGITNSSLIRGRRLPPVFVVNICPESAERGGEKYVGLEFVYGVVFIRD